MKLETIDLLVNDADANTTGKNNRGFNAMAHITPDEIVVNLNVTDPDGNSPPPALTPQT